MFGRLIKWVIGTLTIFVVGTLIGLALDIIFTETPLWGIVVVFMIITVLVFKLGVWVIKNSDYS